MNVEDDTLVIVRGINDDFFKENFGNLCISFGGDSRAVPVKDAYYVGLYLGAPGAAKPVSVPPIADMGRRYVV